jgi:hypothetical protein
MLAIMRRHAAERMMDRPAPQGTMGRQMMMERRGRRRGLLGDSAEAHDNRGRGDKGLDHGAIPLSERRPPRTKCEASSELRMNRSQRRPQTRSDPAACRDMVASAAFLAHGLARHLWASDAARLPGLPTGRGLGREPQR